jgi:hypothetical protein
MIEIVGTAHAAALRRYWIRFRIKDGDKVTEGDVEIVREQPISSSADLQAICQDLGAQMVKAGAVQLGAQITLLHWQAFEQPTVIVAARH